MTPGTIDKKHWYDGQFYDRFVAPHQDAAFAHLRHMIAIDSTVLDVGCGTGRLVLQLADRCSGLDAVDPSTKNIDVARRNLQRHPAPHVRFHRTDVLQFLARSLARFDYATISFVIHEIEESQRNEILQALRSAARRIILVDYLVPQPSGYLKLLNTAVEFAAGRDHYRNFRSFVDGNGLVGLTERAGLNVLTDIKNNPPSTHIVLAAEPSASAEM